MARHIPLVYVATPWDTESLMLTDTQVHHVTRVLRLRAGDAIGYTDGLGTSGDGHLEGHVVVRGQEVMVARPSTVTMAVAPLKSADRTRLIVEKLQELGVASLWWLASDTGQSSAPSEGKARSWAVGALEQSRGAWMMELAGTRSLDPGAQLMDGRGSAGLNPDAMICVGPEGGWSDAEIATASTLVSLGSTVLRTETAAFVAACRAMDPGFAGSSR